MVRTDMSSQHLFPNAFLNATIGMALVDLTGRWMAINQEICRITGYSKQKLLNSRFQEITHPDDINAKLDLINRLISNDIKSYNLESRYIREDGTVTFVWLTSSLVRNESGDPQYFVWQIVDLAEQRSKAFDMEAFFAHAPDLLAISDAGQTLKEVSTAWTELLGWSREELCSRPFIEFVHPDDRERTSKEAQSLYAGNATRGFRNRYRHIDGTYHWLEWNTRIVSEQLYYNVVRDVTRHKQAEEQQLVEHNALYAAHSGILISDATQPGYPIVRCNPALERITGYTCEELIGKSCSLFHGTDTDQEGARELRRAMEQERSCKVILRNYRKNGELFYNSLTLSPVKDEFDRTHHFIGICEDISQQLRFEEELKNRELHLRQITDNIPATVFQWYARANGEMGFYYISDKCEELYGIKAQSLLEDWRRIQVHPDCWPNLMESIQTAIREKSDWHFECRLLLEDGGIRWTRNHSTPTNITDEEIVFTGVILDVTQDHETQEARRNQEEKIRLLIENAHDAFIGMSQDCVITEWNRKAESLFGWTAKEAVGRPLAELIVPEKAKPLYQAFLEGFSRSGKLAIANRILDLPARHKNGSEITVEISANVISHSGRSHLYAFLRDVSKRKEMERKLHYQATHDFLTNLPNRYEFLSRLQRAIQRRARLQTNGGIAVLFIDLDGFKEVNDRLGHEAGDEVLKEFARRLSASIRSADTAARLGGDEFVVLLQDMKEGVEGARAVASKIIATGAEEYEAGGARCRLGVSIGIALYSGKEHADSLLSQADAAMYRAKQTGTNKMAMHDGNGIFILNG